VVHRFKTLTTKRYIDGVKSSDWPPFHGRLWQRNYYEHIARGDDELNRIREYIANNASQWDLDRENPLQSEDVRRKPVEPWEVWGRSLCLPWKKGVGRTPLQTIRP